MAVMEGEDLIPGFRLLSSILLRLHWIFPPYEVADSL
jgi:hypothetical protein